MAHLKKIYNDDGATKTDYANLHTLREVKNDVNKIQGPYDTDVKECLARLPPSGFK